MDLVKMYLLLKTGISIAMLVHQRVWLPSYVEISWWKYTMKKFRFRGGTPWGVTTIFHHHVGGILLLGGVFKYTPKN